MKKIVFAFFLTLLFVMQALTGSFAAEVKADFSLESKKAIDFPALFKLKLPVIADYGSEGCGPCRKMFPALKAANEKYKGKAVIKFVDVWKYREAVGDMPIQLIPTQFFFTSDGRPFVPSKTLAKKFQFQIHKDKRGKHLLTGHQGTLSEGDFDEILKEMGEK